jgi:hypothetical protein
LKLTQYRFFLGVVFLCVAIGVAIQLLGSFNPDVAWINYGVSQMLAGARLYKDVVEVNPPLIYFISMPPYWLASLTGWNGDILYILWVLLFGGFSSMTCYCLVDPMRNGLTKPYLAMCLAQAFLACVLIGESFGQREHFVFMMLSPYAFLKLAQLESRKASAHLALLVGVLAAAAVALKPHYLLVIVFLEIFQVYRLKSIRHTFHQPEVIAGILTACILYALLIRYFPEYLDRMVPIGTKAYLPFYKESTVSILFLFGFSAFLVIVYAFSEIRAGFSAPGQVLMIAAAASTFAMLLQFRGFPYQLLHTLFFLLLSSTFWLFSKKPAKAPWIAFPGIIVASFLLQLNSPLAYKAHFPRDFLAPPGSSVAVFSTNIHDGFPFAPEHELVWTSRFPSLWFIPFIDHVDTALSSARPVDQADVDLANDLRKQVVDDLTTSQPDVILAISYVMFDQPVDYFKTLGKDSRFMNFIASYKKVGTDSNGIDYYRRSLQNLKSGD